MRLNLCGARHLGQVAVSLKIRIYLIQRAELVVWMAMIFHVGFVGWVFNDIEPVNS
jgi:hypothetical protein